MYPPWDLLSKFKKVILAMESKKSLWTSHHAEGLVNPKVRAQKRLLISDTPEYVDSENIKF
jgi:hypothetical protein